MVDHSTARDSSFQHSDTEGERKTTFRQSRNMNEHDDGCMDEARETVRKRWLWRNQKAFSSPVKGFTRLSTFLHPAALSSPPSPSTPSSPSSPPPPRSPPPSAAALLGEVDEEEEEARLQRAVLRERERAAREEWEKKMKGDEGNRMKHPMAMLLQKREASADVTSPSTSTVSSTSSTQPREDKKTKKGKKEEEAKESSLGDSRKEKEKERRTKAAPTKTLSYNVNLHAQVRLRKVQSFVYSSDERSPTSTGLVSKEKRKSAAKKEKQEKKESKKKQKETKKKKQKQKRVGKSKDDSFILRPTTVAGGRTTRSASDASAVTPRVLSMITKPLDEDDMVVVREGNNHHNALDCTQTVVLDADLAATAAATDFEERSRMLALHRAQQRATWVPPLDMAKLAPPTTTTTSSQVRSPYSTIWSSSQSSSSSSSSSSCDISPCTSYSSTNLSSLSVRSAPTTPGSPTSSGSLSAGSKRSGVMEWLHLRRKRGESRGRSLPVRASRSESNSSSSSGLDANDEEAEDDQEATATATATTTTAAAATTAIAIKAKLAGGLSGRSRRRRGVKEDEERVLFPGSAMAFVRREARYAVGLP